MARYHPTLSEGEDPDLLPLAAQKKARSGGSGGRRRRFCNCRRPPLLFIIIWSCFAFLLTANFGLFAKERLPGGRSGLVGWQAFQSVGSGLSSLASTGSQDTEVSTNGSTKVTPPAAGSAAGPALPHDVYAPFVPNRAALTDITVMSCSPISIASCRPPSTAAEEASFGKWVLVPRPLDSQAAAGTGKGTFSSGSISSAMSKLFGSLDTRYIFYRRSHRGNAPKIVELRLVEVGQETPEGGEAKGWHRVKNDLRNPYLRLVAGSRGVHLYYRTDTAGSSKTDQTWKKEGQAAAEEEPITELEILYGDSNPPWPGFEKVGQIVAASQRFFQTAVYLTARRKPYVNPEMDVHPKFNQDGTFKILQIADLHLSVNEEACRDVAWESVARPCYSYNDTLKMMHDWLDTEKPNLVVFTGDQINGQGSSWDPKSTVMKFLQPVIERKIAYATILGNHDSQSGPLSRPEVQMLTSLSPYSLSRVGPPHLHDGVGAGNYYIKLVSPFPDATNLFNLYFLDSGENAPKQLWDFSKDYDWVRRDQVQWFLQASAKMGKILRPYRPDGGKDLPAQNWSGRDGDSSDIVNGQTWDAGSAQGSTLSKPSAITFVHIPLAEFFDGGSNPTKFGPDREETAGRKGAQYKSDFYQGLMSQSDEERDVRLVVSGHMHINADCQRIPNLSNPSPSVAASGANRDLSGTSHHPDQARALGRAEDRSALWTCFGGGSSFAGYGKAGFERRARTIVIEGWGERVRTWSRMEDGRKDFEGTLWDDSVKTT